LIVAVVPSEHEMVFDPSGLEVTVHEVPAGPSQLARTATDNKAYAVRIDPAGLQEVGVRGSVGIPALSTQTRANRAAPFRTTQALRENRQHPSGYDAGPMRLCPLLLVLVSACGSAQAVGTRDEPARSFYYWRTTFSLSPAEREALGTLHVSRLYLRLFDVAWRDGAPSIEGPVSGDPAPELEIIPVVFLRDEVFRHPAPELAARVWGQIRERAAALGFTPHELQFDCDWTDATRDAYFGFLRDIRARANLPLSATIRLHQVKYRERTGVPPVERGTLMFYNMGKGAHTIFDPIAAGRYLTRIPSYPLPLDAALPIWSWTLQERDDHVHDILQSTDPDELSVEAFPFLRTAPGGRWMATETAFLHGALLREGDLLEAERIGPIDTFAAATMLAPLLPRAPRTVTLFDLSERNLKRHGTDSLDDVFRTFRR
jgi:hypothetical protein